MATHTSGYEEHRTTNAFLFLSSRQITQTSGSPARCCDKIYKKIFNIVKKLEKNNTKIDKKILK